MAGSGALHVLDAAAARRWAVTALSALGAAREEIDALNVYPVPDGDTGTNLYLTVEAACAAVLALPPTAEVAEVAGAFARGALLGARGNSGVITAQLLNGWADVLAERGVLDAPALREAFARSDAQAWAAVAEPVEGTILSVSRHVAQVAAASSHTLLGALVGECVEAARTALARTPQQLEVLRRAGVVDAGGRGLVVVLEALDEVITGRRGSRPSGRSAGPVRAAVRPAQPALPVPPPSADDDECSDHRPGDPAYEVMYLLEATAPDVSGLRAELARLGDSLVVVGGGSGSASGAGAVDRTLWHVHVHTDDPGAAVEAGVVAGRPHRIRITHFADHLPQRGPTATTRPHGPVGGLVACAAGPGLAALFQAAGAVVVATGPGRRPSTGELLAAIRETGASAVAVLPNDGDTLTVARAAAAAARKEGVRVVVVPTRAQVQGLAAAAVHDVARPFDEDVSQMSATAGSARDGAVTVAARDAFTLAGPCVAGDALGIVHGEFAVVGKDLAAVAVEVLDRLLSQGGELVTVVVGASGADEAAAAVLARLRRRRDLEVSVIEGGQERYPLLLGVE